MASGQPYGAEPKYSLADPRPLVLSGVTTTERVCPLVRPVKVTDGVLTVLFAIVPHLPLPAPPLARTA